MPLIISPAQRLHQNPSSHQSLPERRLLKSPDKPLTPGPGSNIFPARFLLSPHDEQVFIARRVVPGFRPPWERGRLREKQQCLHER